jgi:AhpD family alkylhydroperoxidase
MKPFQRRIYTLKAFWREFRYLMRHRDLIRRAMRSGRVSEAFRERLMLVVTEVNGCRYCRAFHSQEALKAGLSQQELHTLLQGLIPENAPEEEYAALLFARYWAERDGQVEPAVLQDQTARYGAETVQDILTILRLIRMGNLLGNSWDYLLYRLTCGRLGLQADESRYAAPSAAKS